MLLQQDASSVNYEATNGIYPHNTNSRAQQVAKEANQVESIFQRPSVRKASASPSSKRKNRRIAPSDEDRLYEDVDEDSTDPYNDNLNDNSKSL